MGWGYERRGVMFYVVAGPQFGFFLDEKGHKGGAFDETTLNLRPGHIYQQYDMPLKNKFEYGITAGARIRSQHRHRPFHAGRTLLLRTERYLQQRQAGHFRAFGQRNDCRPCHLPFRHHQDKRFARTDEEGPEKEEERWRVNHSFVWTEILTFRKEYNADLCAMKPHRSALYSLQVPLSEHTSILVHKPIISTCRANALSVRLS